MWLKRKEEMFNLDHFTKIEVQLLGGSDYYLLLKNASTEDVGYNYRLGPFGKGEAQLYFEKIAAAMQTGEKLWEFPANAEDLKLS